MHNRKEILTKLKIRMRDYPIGTCMGCPITIYDEVFGRGDLADTSCGKAGQLLLGILEPKKYHAYLGCSDLYRYVYEMKIGGRKNCRI